MRAHGSSSRVRSMLKNLLLSAAVVLLWTPSVRASTIVDFTGPYIPVNWTTTFVQCDRLYSSHSVRTRDNWVRR